MQTAAADSQALEEDWNWTAAAPRHTAPPARQTRRCRPEHFYGITTCAPQAVGKGFKRPSRRAKTYPRGPFSAEGRSEIRCEAQRVVKKRSQYGERGSRWQSPDGQRVPQRLDSRRDSTARVKLKPAMRLAPEDWRSSSAAEQECAGDDCDSRRTVSLGPDRPRPARRKAREAHKPAPGTARTSLPAVSSTYRLPISCHGFGLVATDCAAG